MLASPKADCETTTQSAIRRPTSPAVLADLEADVDRAAGEASLSLEKDATLVPEVSYFTVPFPASSHRLRAPAPYKRESSTGVQILGGARGALPGMPKCTMIYVTFAIVCLTSLIVL